MAQRTTSAGGGRDDGQRDGGMTKRQAEQIHGMVSALEAALLTLGEEMTPMTIVVAALHWAMHTGEIQGLSDICNAFCSAKSAEHQNAFIDASEHVDNLLDMLGIPKESDHERPGE